MSVQRWRQIGASVTFPVRSSSCLWLIPRSVALARLGEASGWSRAVGVTSESFAAIAFLYANSTLFVAVQAGASLFVLRGVSHRASRNGAAVDGTLGGELRGVVFVAACNDLL